MSEVCRFINPTGSCAILTERKCPGMCSFFVTPAELAAKERRHDELLTMKPEVEQARIAALYYGGKRPWLERKREVNDK